ncbi:hypothetical protein MKX08_000117 [Trichoderma sp. CBMAI-0020]|nr:hypothetical protein MKX08_000117 [Trichoderma sp. CBMAI-0020]
MSQQPPSCKDVLGILPINSDALLLVRLEVWHYFKLGRSPILNHDLAQLFIALELANWTVKEVEIIEPKGLASRDEFVPVQVDFEHRHCTDNDPNGRAQYDVRELFRHVAPALVFQFFLKIGSKPHIMNLFPLNVPQLHKNKYVQIYPINKLNITSQRFLKPAEVEDTKAIATLLSTLDDGLSALSQVVGVFDLYSDLMGQNETPSTFTYVVDAEDMFRWAATIFDTIGSPATVIRNVGTRSIHSTMTLRQSYEAQVKQAAASESANLFAWQLAVNPFFEYQAKFSGIARDLQQIEAGEGSLLFTKAKKSLEPQLANQLDLYSKDMRQLKNIRNISGLATGLAAVAGILKGTGIGGASIQSLVSHLPLGWWGIGAIFIGGIIVGSCAQSDIKTSFKKKGAFQEFNYDLQVITYAANEARKDLVTVICKRNFNIELSELGDHEKNKILESFGVDVNAVQHKEYCEALTGGGTSKLLEFYRRLIADFDQMRKACGFGVVVEES